MKSLDEAYAGLDAESRLARLVDSGRCAATNSKKYRAELRELVSASSKGRNLRSQSDVFKALSAEIRLKMLYTLLKRELCECEIMVGLNLTQSTASHHLSILERAGLVTKAKRGKWVFYSATEEGRSQIVGGGRLARRSSSPQVPPP